MAFCFSAWWPGGLTAQKALLKSFFIKSFFNINYLIQIRNIIINFKKFITSLNLRKTEFGKMVIGSQSRCISWIILERWALKILASPKILKIVTSRFSSLKVLWTPCFSITITHFEIFEVLSSVSEYDRLNAPIGIYQGIPQRPDFSETIYL